MKIMLPSQFTLFFVLLFFIDVRSGVFNLQVQHRNNVFVKKEMEKKAFASNFNHGGIPDDYDENNHQHLENDSHQSGVSRNLRHVNNEPNEIIEAAEMYFRPLSRYRELQERKNHRNLKNENQFVSNSNQKQQIFSASPEYCITVQQGYVCYYRIQI